MAKASSKTKEPTAKAVASKAVKVASGAFDSKLINSFKKNKNLQSKANFKPQTWIPFSPALNDVIGLPGAPEGQITILRGLSDTGKTLAMLEAAISAQKMGKLVVFIITELKWSWTHAKTMGFQVDEIVDEDTGELTYSGDFIYVDRTTLPSIESIGSFILDIMEEQSKGKLPYDLVFCVDSLGSVPCDMSIASGKNDARWNSGAMSLTFSNFINFKFPATRKLDCPYTNTMICVVKQGIKYPATPVEKPKRTSKGSESLYFDAGLVIDWGNITNAGTSKIEATKNGKSVVFAKRTKVAIEKNHITNSASSGKILMSDYGFIPDTKAAIDSYKEAHKHEWLTTLGTSDFDIVEEAEVPEDKLAAKEMSFLADDED